MKQHKHIGFGLLVAVMLFILAACGTSNQTAPEKSTGGGEKAPAETAKEKLVIGTDAAYAPFESIDKGQIVGFDADVLAAVMKEAGYDYELKNTGWEPLFQSVKNGDVAFGISAITILDDRKKTYDFTVPYFEAKQMILVPEGSKVEKYADLTGKVVGVQTGTTGDEKAQELLGAKSNKIKKYETTPLAIMALLSGEVEAVIADNGVVSSYVANNPDQKVVAVSDNDSFKPEFYGMMFKQGNGLREEINTAINTILDNGTYADIYKKWFGEEPNIDLLKQQQ